MHVINFLPDDYLQRRSLRRANLLCLALGGGALVALGALSGLFVYRAMQVTVERTIAESQYAEASRQIDQLKQLENRKTGLLHKVELSTTLLERVPRSYLLARLTNYLPAHTSLTSLTMRVEETQVKAASAGAAGKAAAPAAAKPPAGKAKEEMVKVKRVRFRLDGLAQTDVEVAEFITRLNADPVFEDVDLQFSEEHQYGVNTAMRRFQISLRVSPKAEKILETVAVKSPAAPATVKGTS